MNPFARRIGRPPGLALSALLISFGMGSPGHARGATQAVASDSVASHIQRRVEAGIASGTFWAEGERLTASRSLPSFYVARNFEPAWVAGGHPTPLVGRLVQAIEGTEDDGLRPDDYHLVRLRQLRDTPTRLPATEIADLELLASDAFLVLGSHLLHGRVDPVRVRAEWLANRRSADMAAVLSAAIRDGDIEEALDALRPGQARYRQMRQALAGLRSADSSGGWSPVGDGSTLRLGDVDPRVRDLRRRLAASGDLASSDSGAPSEYDQEVETAVRVFQERHGLDVDGAVGAGTLEALNVPVSARIEQLVVNLERWRWMPDDLGPRHILVNIPDYSVSIREDGAEVMRLRAIVGRHYRQTPVFTGAMTYLVLAPFWHVPPGIAVNDKFPVIRQDPAYIQRQRMTVLDLRTNEPVDPVAVDWAAMTPAELNRRFRLRQDPGPLNALGDVKFMFPNEHNVYLHDTPSRELFARTERSFSSGCIRIDRPLELADYLLAGDPAWTGDRIRAVAAAGRETTVRLSSPVPVHLQYWTAFVDDAGRLNYRRDLYSRDAAVLEALRTPPPAI